MTREDVGAAAVCVQRAVLLQSHKDGQEHGSPQREGK